MTGRGLSLAPSRERREASPVTVSRERSLNPQDAPAEPFRASVAGDDWQTAYGPSVVTPERPLSRGIARNLWQGVRPFDALPDVSPAASEKLTQRAERLGVDTLRTLNLKQSNARLDRRSETRWGVKVRAT